MLFVNRSIGSLAVAVAVAGVLPRDRQAPQSGKGRT